MKNSKIEWTDHTFNPWIGCTHVSPGCVNCYAERDWAKRRKRVEWGPGKPRSRTTADYWKQPVRWNAQEIGQCQNCGIRQPAGWRGATATTCSHCTGPRHLVPARPRVFCASLADWLDPEVPVEWLADLLALIHATPNLDWLLLTKRPGLFGERIRKVRAWMTGILHALQPDGEAVMLSNPNAEDGLVHVGKTKHELECLLKQYSGAMEMVCAWTCSDWDSHADVAPSNVWIGTTVEDQRRADERIPELLRIPARVRFLSCEPLLGAVCLDGSSGGDDFLGDPEENASRSEPGIDWLICGGESGPNARPMHPDWARGLRDQCQAAGVPFFFKQWGEWAASGPHNIDMVIGSNGAVAHPKYALAKIDNPGNSGRIIVARVGKHRAGRLLDGREWSEFPSLPPLPSVQNPDLEQKEAKAAKERGENK